MASSRVHIPIDRFGRVVLPKGTRERLGISSGTEFEVEEREDVILLRPRPKEANVTEKDGWPVFSLGNSLTVEEVNNLVKKTRRENRK
jgi:AbrB family looped-hinge helix DNA binding protein